VPRRRLAVERRAHPRRRPQGRVGDQRADHNPSSHAGDDRAPEPGTARAAGRAARGRRGDGRGVRDRTRGRRRGGEAREDPGPVPHASFGRQPPHVRHLRGGVAAIAPRPSSVGAEVGVEHVSANRRVAFHV
jgi:hypothetical protein